MLMTYRFLENLIGVGVNLEEKNVFPSGCMNFVIYNSGFIPRNFS